jgi:DNA-binding response OmpR family regulator
MSPNAGTDDGSWDVLVVDDEEVVREGVRRILEAAGLRVATAAAATSALAHPALATCGAVLCDLMLPDGDGFEIARRVRSLRGDVAVVAMSGYRTQETVERALSAGMSAFLPKPFDASELLAVVRRVPRRRS